MYLKDPNLLRDAMLKAEKGQFRLSQAVGCNRSYISHLVAGRRSTCSTELAERIAQELNVPTSVLFGFSSSKIIR